MVDAPETTTAPFRALNVAVVGGGIGGLTTALSLRREGRTSTAASRAALITADNVTVYERTEFLGASGRSIDGAEATRRDGRVHLLRRQRHSLPQEVGCVPQRCCLADAAGFNTQAGLPVPLGSLTMHDWHSGKVLNEYVRRPPLPQALICFGTRRLRKNLGERASSTHRRGSLTARRSTGCAIVPLLERPDPAGSTARTSTTSCSARSSTTGRGRRSRSRSTTGPRAWMPTRASSSSRTARPSRRT